MTNSRNKTRKKGKEREKLVTSAMICEKKGRERKGIE